MVYNATMFTLALIACTSSTEKESSFHTESSPTPDSAADSPADSPGDSPADSPGDSPADSAPDSDPPPPPSNLLLNPGFELGETWLRWPTTRPNHAWATTGEAIHDSAALFTAHGGEHAQKVWGAYQEYPNETWIYRELTSVVAGDSFTLSGYGFTPTDDRLTAGSTATLFLKFFTSDWTWLGTATSASLDSTSAADVWHALSATGTAPEGTTLVQAGILYTQPDADAGGAAYFDDFTLTTSGSAINTAERLLVWDDAFDGTTLDEGRWNRVEWPPYTVNNELQAYTAREENASVADGALTIRALREDYDGAAYTSARLTTAEKGDWVEGRFEVRAALPTGVGTWPAIWLYPTDLTYGGWPNSGEIDIMEHVGCQLNTVYSSIHTDAYNHVEDTEQQGSIGVDVAGFHTYALEWDSAGLIAYVDDEPFFWFNNDGAGDFATWPFDQRFHLILNLAVGGDWGGWCGVDEGAFPEEMIVDWVRVYQYP